MIQDHSEPSAPPPNVAAAWDHVLPRNLISSLSRCFAPISQFWKAHNYSDGSRKPPSPYFSYILPLAPCSASSLSRKNIRPAEAGVEMTNSTLMEVIRYFQETVSEAFPKVMSATAAEWWCHCRPHSSGHQFHFDSDNEGKGGVRNPLASCVLYVSPSGVGGETLVTSQEATGSTLATIGHLCAARRNRLLAFRGNLLHGVVPGAGAAAAHCRGRRVTFMVAFWRKIRVRNDPGLGAARPFSRVASRPWAAPLVASPDIPAAVAETTTAAEKSNLLNRTKRRAKRAFFRVPLWEDVNKRMNEQDGASLRRIHKENRMPPYDAFFQFA